ncbi:DUF6342 family protein [Kitasatospora sp. NPDC051984]|uniref:DUF6342 family protein n=1 Tax=Kitasatospora sp. NPDC051984 TaxID=3364059 RepID=UPI0037C84920
MRVFDDSSDCGGGCAGTDQAACGRKQIAGILDASGNLYIAGKVITDRKDLSW